jgi:saccharopine dehydrogenase (NAD+, L-lysine forming)
MRVLVVEARGVGAAVASVALRRDFFERMVFADIDEPVELLAAGVWQGMGVVGLEAFPPQPFLDLLADYGAPHGIEDR